jgi:hypothetical protein
MSSASRSSAGLSSAGLSSAGPATTALGPRNAADVAAVWAERGAAALSAYGTDKSGLCIAACRETGTLLTQLPRNDPRRAATLNNLGIAALLAGAADEAEESFAAAGTAWRAAKTWVAAMTLPRPARSSLHHLRLERRHRNDYDALLRRSQLRLLGGGRAASLFNRAACAAGRASGLCPSAQAALARAVAQRLRALGPHNPEAAQMCDLRADLADARGDPAAAAAHRAEARRIADSPARGAMEPRRELNRDDGSDPWRLKAAVCFTLVVTGPAITLGVKSQSPGRD